MHCPSIRFAGFTDAWEVREFDNLVSRVPSMAEGEPGLPSVEYEDIISGQGQLNKNIYEKQNNKRGIYFRPGDILFGKLRPYLQNWLAPNFTGIAVGDWWVLRPNDANSEFIYALIQSLKYQEVSNLTTGTKMPRSDWNIVSKTPFVVPSQMAEQSQIGATFRNLDRLITLHQRKHDKTVNIKKALIEKMFPKAGEDKPEIRFAGFTDAWEQRELVDDIISIQTGTNLLSSSVNTGTPLLKMGNIQRGYFSLDKLEFLEANAQVEPDNIVHYGDFFFNTRNTLELVGKGAIWTGNSGKYAFNSNIARFKFKGIDTTFFNYMYNTKGITEQVHAIAVGTTSVAAVYPRDLYSLKYFAPQVEEQRKIGSFFTNLDHLITLHQRELTKLQNIKKALLEKMFV